MAAIVGMRTRGLGTPELVIVDGGKGLEAALAGLIPEVAVQRCTVHKERNLLAHAPKHLHDEIKADFTDMMYAADAKAVQARRKAFLAKWRLRCREVAVSLEEAGGRLFTFLRYPPEQWRSLRTTDEMDKLFLRCRGMILGARMTSWRRATHWLKAPPGCLIQALPA